MHLLNCTIKSELFPSNDCYPFIIPAIRFLNKLDFTSPVTIFAGDNGSGKSTLLRAITMRCNIHIWSGPEREKPGYNLYEDRLWEFLDITWAHGPVPGSFFGAEMFRHFAQNVDEWASLSPGVLDYYGGRPLTSQSHGQCHLSYFRNRYGIKGLYFLDEPENALAPAKELELMKLMHRVSRQGHAQFIMATHSPILMACPGAKILSFDSSPLKEVLYEDTEHFRFYREFMNNREKFIDP